MTLPATNGEGEINIPRPRFPKAEIGSIGGKDRTNHPGLRHIMAPTLLRIGLGMEPDHRYSDHYLAAKERKLARQHGPDIAPTAEGAASQHGEG